MPAAAGGLTGAAYCSTGDCGVGERGVSGCLANDGDVGVRQTSISCSTKAMAAIYLVNRTDTQFQLNNFLYFIFFHQFSLFL